MFIKSWGGPSFLFPNAITLGDTRKRLAITWDKYPSIFEYLGNHVLYKKTNLSEGHVLTIDVFGYSLSIFKVKAEKNELFENCDALKLIIFTFQILIIEIYLTAFVP